MNNKLKKNVLFVGAFNSNTKDGSTGGQLFACTTLINSELKNRVNFITIDSTSKRVPAPPLIKRIPYVFIRLFKFIFYLLFFKIETVIIFTSAGFSFYEKGVLSLVGKLFNKKIILAPRSGLIKRDYNSNKFSGRFISYVINSVDFVICQGESWKDFYFEISNKKNKDKFYVINNWIDVNPYLDNLKSNAELSENKKIIKIAYIGWLEEYKGINDLLDALILLKDSNSSLNYICNIYGNGSLYQRANEIIEKFNLENVKIKGWADYETKMKALKDSDIFVIPSHFEGFPNTLLEAMVSKKAIITTSIPAILDIVSDRKNALVVKKSSPKEISNNLNYLLNDPKLLENISSNAQVHVIKNFTLDKAIIKFNNII